MTRPEVFEFLRERDNSDTATNANIAKNHSGGGLGPAWYEYVATETTYCRRLVIYVQDGGNFTAVTSFGGGSALTTGLRLFVLDTDGSTELVDFIGDSTDAIRSNAGWSRFCYDVNYLSFGSGDNVIAARWTLANCGVHPVLLAGQRLALRVVDNVSAVSRFTIQLQAYRPKRVDVNYQLHTRA